MDTPRSFRARIFLVIMLVALIPMVLTLASATLVVRQLVVATGTAGAWDQIAESGRDLLAEVDAQAAPPPELLAAAERHRAELAESVRMSRLYAFLGERVLVLLPIFALIVLLLVWGLALVAANRLAKGFSRPLEEIVSWTRALGTGERLPPSEPDREAREVEEFRALRQTFRWTEGALQEARRRERERIRMNSWSEMARKVAHEIKNPLTPMRMAAERVSRSEDPRVAEAGVVLREEIGRLDELARTFSQFGRPPEGPMASVDLVELLNGLSRRLSTDDAPIEVDAPDGPVEVTGHLEAIERVARNLLSNAQEATAALEDHGRTPPAIRVLVRTGDEQVEIRFQDRGPGIPGDVLPRIWHPDFTTKRKGTGLGLQMVRQAVHAHGGEVHAANREGGGAEFLVVLPHRPPVDPAATGSGLRDRVKNGGAA